MVTFWMPHGMMRSKGARSPQMLSAKPCIVIQWRTPTPMDAILRLSIQTPVRPGRVLPGARVLLRNSCGQASALRSSNCLPRRSLAKAGSYLRYSRNSKVRVFLRAQMRQSNRERVGGVGIRSFCQTEKRAHHKRDLNFCRAAASHSRLFDSARRVFKNGQTIFCCGENSCATGRAEQNRRFITLHVDDRFERATIRFVFAN